MMENVKAESSSSPEDGTDQATASADLAARAAKSVISIHKDNVTIISTGKNGKSSKPAKVTTTPLRGGQDPSLTGPSNVGVSTRIKDTQFVTALNQQFQANGSLSVPSRSAAPSSSSCSSRASACHSRSSSSSSGIGEDLTSKLSSMLLQQQQQQQQQLQEKQQQQLQQNQQVEVNQKNGSPGEEGQSVPEEGSGPSPPSPPAPCPSGSSDLVNGASSGRGSGTSSPDIPPTPPPSALLRAITEQPQLRKVDASYTPRPNSYSTQNPTAAAGNVGSPKVKNKHDLMAALTAVVTSGSPVSGLRKTRGPGRGGGVTEVFTSKKSTGNSTTGSTGAAAAPPQKDN